MTAMAARRRLAIFENAFEPALPKKFEIAPAYENVIHTIARLTTNDVMVNAMP